eukprot:3731101-Rhodomonas_salina.4
MPGRESETASGPTWGLRAGWLCGKLLLAPSPRSVPDGAKRVHRRACISVPAASPEGGRTAEAEEGVHHLKELVAAYARSVPGIAKHARRRGAELTCETERSETHGAVFFRPVADPGAQWSGPHRLGYTERSDGLEEGKEDDTTEWQDDAEESDRKMQ